MAEEEIKEEIQKHIEKLENKIKELEIERDYYKKMYIEFNNAFIKGE